MKMKVRIHRSDGPPIEVESDCVAIAHGADEFEIRPTGDALLLRIEQHDGSLAMDLAVFPHGGNSIRVKGGLR